MDIRKIILEEIDEFDWIHDVTDPWDGMDEELVGQLTDGEKNVVDIAFDWDTDEWSKYGCVPIYEIIELAVRERKLWVAFKSTCDGETHHITLYINRDTLEWYMA